jgi:hypothetical protein
VSLISAWALAAMTILVGATLIARGLPARSTGRHRAGRGITVPFAELMPDWPAAPGALVTQAFVHCPLCEVETAATVHGTALRCAEGHLVTGGRG